MKVNYLLKDDLIYELRVRGVTEVTTVDHMRQMLRQLVRLPATSSFVLPPYPFTFAEDVEAVTARIATVTSAIESFSGDCKSTEYLKLTTTLAFLYGRVNRMPAAGPEEESRRSALLVKLINLSSQLTIKTSTLERMSTTDHDAILDLSAINTYAPLEEMFRVSDSDDEGLASAIPRPTTAPQIKVRSVPVSAWGVKFSGNAKDLSLGAFLERVDELKVARHSSDALLFSGAVDLFSGIALTWFRANKNNFTSWGDIVEGLRLEFLPPDHDDKLFEEIKRRTQGTHETMGVYVSVMKGLFSRLATRLPEATQLKIVSRNLLPFYQTQLGLVTVNSFDELIKYGRQIEARKTSVEAYVPPPSRLRSLEPDLAYVSAQPAPTPSVHTSHAVQASRSRTIRPAVSVLTCWNCHKTGHRSAQCTEPRQRHCFRCGRPNVIVSSCPKCSGNANRAQ